MQDFRVSRHVTKQFHPARLSWSQLFMAKRSGNLAALIVPLSCPSHYRPTTAALLPRFCQTMMAPSVKLTSQKEPPVEVPMRYSQSPPLVEKERLTAEEPLSGGPARDLHARSDQRIGIRPMKPSIRSPLPSGLKDDHVASDRPSIGRRIFRTLTRFFMRFSSVSAPHLPGSPTVTQHAAD
jgi:hypothetical protein